MSIVFYAAPQSSASPVSCALRELEVPHERVNVDLSKGEQRKPEFLALNPNGKVPTLVVNGTPLFEAIAILQWLGDRFGVEKKLWPAADSPARLEALSWTTWGYVQFGYALALWYQSSSERLPKERHNAALSEYAGKELQNLLGLLDARLSQRSYLLGAEFSLADLILGSVINYAHVCGVSIAAHARVQGWLERVLSRPSMQNPWV
ncbi:MAG TPA: glutathione S-transferase family protein [Polyangiaceae bacterium]|nr:glutathione S-transferase family protein [Polyangiaceae bacterium]